jgi:hypothetical protein
MNRFKLFTAALVASLLALPLAAVAEDAPGTFTIPGTDTKARFYGYVQLDANYDLSSRLTDINNNDWATFVALQPLENTLAAKKRDRQLYLTARTSRFGLTTSTPSAFGPIGTKLEADFNSPNGFWGESYTNSVLFRLRHAYGTVGGLLIGQTWTTFADLGSFADTVDFNGPGSTPLIRQPQVRYTIPFGAATLALAAENAANSLTGGSGRIARIPDLIANFTTPTSFGHVSVRGLTLNYDNTVHSKQGWGLAASGSARIGGDTLVAMAEGGEGIGRYLFNAFNLYGSGFAVDTGTGLKLWQAVAYHIGYTHVWNPKFRSNLVWSQTFIGRNGIAAVNATIDPATGYINNSDDVSNKRIDQAFVNTFWSFAKNAEVGLEYAYGRRKTFDGNTGREDRINASVHYNFF